LNLSTLQTAAIDSLSVLALSTLQNASIDSLSVLTLSTLQTAAIDSLAVSSLSTLERLSVNLLEVSSLSTLSYQQIDFLAVSSISTLQTASIEFLAVSSISTLNELVVLGSTILSTIFAGTIYAQGDMYATGFNNYSDRRLKSNIQQYIPKQLPDPVEFEWIKTGTRDIGVIAQDVFTIEPACVQSTADGTLCVDYSKLTILLLAQVKDLQKQVQELRAALL
jgi:hypothetical protein